MREPGARKRFVAFLRLNLLSGIAILPGYILFVLPGLYLSVRWTLASTILLARDGRAGNPLRESWARTRPAFWAIFGTLLVILVPAGVVAVGLTATLGESFPILSSSLAYLFLFASFVTSWLAGVAIYSLLQTDQDALAEVFA